MSRIINIFLLMCMQLLLSVSVNAQKDITQFLGIPIDGYKPEMIKKLKDKGFVISPSNKDALVGEFNGTKVNVNIATNNNKVCRIMVSDVNTIDEGDVKIRFNNLCKQFLNNKKYMSASLSDSSYTISEDEDISYEMSVNSKRYQAVFYQLSTKELDSTVLKKELNDYLLKKYTQEQISNPTEEIRKNMIKDGVSYMLDRFSKKVVWFMISELYGKYYITMFYDNEYNRANGEDL
jgi:hypothetical protein